MQRGGLATGARHSSRATRRGARNASSPTRGQAEKTRVRPPWATQESHTYSHVGPSRDRRLARASTTALGPKRERWGDRQLVDVPDAHQLNALRDALLITQRWKTAPRNTKREKKTAGTSVSAPCAQPNQQRTRGGQTIKAGAATAGQWRTMPHGVVPGHTARARGRPADARQQATARGRPRGQGHHPGTGGGITERPEGGYQQHIGRAVA